MVQATQDGAYVAGELGLNIIWCQDYFSNGWIYFHKYNEFRIQR